MVDLHIHTKYSDGEDDEYEIIRKIKDAKIQEFAICDHDTIEGSKRVNSLIANEFMFHSGVELSCKVSELYGGIDVHLLVRDFNYDNKKILGLIQEISYLRKLKIQRMVELIKEAYGIEIKDMDIEEVSKTTNSFGKPHMYFILQKYGDFNREEYYKNMNKLKSLDLKLDAVRVLNVLKGEKCNVTLAHPIEIMEENSLRYEDIDNIVKHLKTYGLYGLETRHSKHSNSDFREFSSIAKKYGLVETCGSDYHGEKVKPNVKLGVCCKE